MNKEAHIHMLVALRAQVEAIHATINGALSVLAGPAQEDEPGGCRHPPERRVDTTAQGGPAKFLCLDCGSEHEVAP